MGVTGVTVDALFPFASFRHDAAMAVMTDGAKRDVLAATPLFASLSREELTALAALATERRVRRDAGVVRRGDPDASLLILVNGRLRAGSVSSDGREVTIGVMEPGTVVGEIALLDGRPRSMDVTAMSDSVLLVVERREFLPFLSARPDLMLRVMALLCDRLRKASKAFEDVALAPLSARLARLLLGLGGGAWGAGGGRDADPAEAVAEGDERAGGGDARAGEQAAAAMARGGRAGRAGWRPGGAAAGGAAGAAGRGGLGLETLAGRFRRIEVQRASRMIRVTMLPSGWIVVDDTSGRPRRS